MCVSKTTVFKTWLRLFHNKHTFLLLRALVPNWPCCSHYSHQMVANIYGPSKTTEFLSLYILLQAFLLYLVQLM